MKSFIIVSGVSMSSAFVYNVTSHSPVGLTIPCRGADGTEVVPCIVDSKCNGIPSVGVDAIQTTTDPVPIFVHTSDTRLEHLCIHGRSEFAEVYSRVMLVPSTTSSTSFQLITGVVEPNQYCADGTIAMAQFAHPISFHTRVNLIANAERPASAAILETRESASAFYDIDTTSLKDRIGVDVYYTLLDELEALSGTRNLPEMDFATLIPQMPSLLYTIYFNDNGGDEEDAITRVILNPADYVVQLEDGRYELQVEPAIDNDWFLGVNFLKYVAVFLNYENRQIGFCEPL